MSQEIIPAADCTEMREVRAAIDALDVAIVALLGERMRYIEAAARIKPSRDQVRDEWRKADVIAKVCKAAAARNFPPELAASVYDVLVEGSIAHEFERFDARG
ncbi:chorismate mutase [Sphingomonas oleivorans]|uniref:chorismate mutase n=1 Tax=Sphingomonas oleivorans TaxID=1735121 RepID=A0A2T5G190_9SPHN|nr:chorismate mutase [Sphingomonas oleivorans]PTQ12909.1 chorismate mutase [Sphingomonas oleivorans]